MANGIDFKGTNKAYGPPEGVTEDQCKTLRVFTNGACIVSCWELTPNELTEINRTGKVFLSVWSAGGLPPTFVGAESVVHEVVADFGAVWPLSNTDKTENVRNQIIEECAKIIDDCNASGPYNAISGARLIRELKT